MILGIIISIFLSYRVWRIADNYPNRGLALSLNPFGILWEYFRKSLSAFIVFLLVLS